MNLFNYFDIFYKEKDTLLNYLSDDYSGCSVPSIEESYYNHMLVFAAEKARLENCVVDIESFMK